MNEIRISMFTLFYASNFDWNVLLTKVAPLGSGMTCEDNAIVIHFPDEAACERARANLAETEIEVL